MIFSRVAGIVLLTSIACFGQESRGTISGAVTDPSGAAIAGAKVIATEVRTGTKVQTVSESTGQYTLPFLSSGDYTVSATMQGFKEFVRKGIQVGAGDHVAIDVRLEVGDTATSVEVTGDAPLLNTENASQGQAITTHEVEDMPLNGGTPAMLSQFALGVIPTSNPTLVHPFDVVGPAAISIGGTPSQTSELLLDGVPNATWDGRQAYSPPRDAVQEVRVKAFDSDSSFGHTGGGTLNQVLKTGTNSFHTTLWEYNQPSNLAANSFFNNRAGVAAAVTHYNQYGFVAGGPVLLPKFNGRDKLFWMFSFEGLPDSQPNPTNLTVPTDAEKRGDFSALLGQGSQYQLYDPFSAVTNGSTVTRTPLSGNVIPTNRLNPVALNYMKFYPAPNTTIGVSPIGQNNYISNVPTTDSYNNELGRLDYNMSTANRMFFDVRRFGYSSEKQDYFQNPATGIATFRESWGSTVDDVVTFSPTTIADIRLNFTRLGEGHAVNSHGIDVTSLGFPSYLAAASQFAQLPIMSLSTFQQLGGNSTKSNNYPSQSWQLFAQVMKLRGNHALKFGVDLRQYRVNPIDFGNSSGQFNLGNTWVRSSSSASSTVAQGQDLASMLMGLTTGGSFDLSSFASFYSYYGSGFIQDDWRATRNLTVNLGIRYDFDGPYHEKWARTVNGFAFNTPSPIAASAQAAYAASPYAGLPAGAFKVLGGLTFASPSDTRIYQNTSHLASPRAGLAWSPDFLKHKTVIRAGFGMFVTPVTIASLSVNGNYSTNPILAQEGFTQSTSVNPSNDNFVTPASTLSNPFPNGIALPAGSSAGIQTFYGQTVNFLNPQMKNPYSLRWNFGLQHELTANTMLEVVYIANHSVHLPITVTQLNGIPRQYLSTLAVRDNAVNTTLSASTPNPFKGLLPSTAAMNTSSTVTIAQLLARYPQFPVGYGSGVWSGSAGILEQDLDAGSSYFGSLNVRLQRRFSKGVSIIANYIWSRLAEQDSWLNESDPVPEKRISPFDRPQRIVTYVSWDLPIGRGRALNVNSRLANAIVGGWHLNSVYTWQIGAPLAWVNGSTTTPSDYVYYGGPGALPTSMNNRQANTLPNGTPIAAFDTSLFNTNASNAFAYHIRTFSTTFPNVRADGINEWDPSLLKRIDVTERAYVQLRFEFFNVVNHPTFSAPNVQWSSGPSSFGVINGQSNRPRTIQVGARFVW
jgi:hypothetical protein